MYVPDDGLRWAACHESRSGKGALDTAVKKSGQVGAAGEADYLFEGIQGSPCQWEYRNKMEFSFGDEYKDGPLSLGLHKKASTYDVLTVDDCKIVHSDFTKILRCVLDYFIENPQPYYKKMQHRGIFAPSFGARANTTGKYLSTL